MFVFFFFVILVCRIPLSTDATALFFQKKLEKHGRFHTNQHHGGAASMPGTVWTHFQCDPKISPFIGVGFGCYCPGTWCTTNGECCSQMCYKKTCY
jgi:hypothetical protein